MSTEIKVYLDSSKDEQSLCFHATVHDNDDYDVYFDLNETYEVLLSEALKNVLEIEYLDKDFKKQNLTIQSLKEFKRYLEEFYDLKVELNSLDFYNLVGVRLVGDGYRYDENIPMLEAKEYSIRNLLHNMKTTLLEAVNNSNYNGDDIYLKKDTGSLIMKLETVKEYKEHIEFMKSIYEDIENRNVDLFKFQDNNKKESYQKIIKAISKLNNQKKLKEFYLIIGNKEFEIKNRDYLKAISKEIYLEDIEISGEYQGYKKGLNSFEIKQEIGTKSKKYYCHLDELQKNDVEAYNEAMKILQQLDVFSKKKVILKVLGKKIKPKTIDVKKIEKL